MRKRATPIIATALGALLAASTAHAYSDHVNYIPNGKITTCNYCHPDGNLSALNPFGKDVQPLVDLPVANWWPQLRDLDSDGDGQTNAQELGDPCEVWLVGDVPGRKDDISNPGDAGSTSPTPDEPSCDGGGSAGSGGGEGGGAPTTGTDTGTSGSTTSPTGGGNTDPSGGQGGSKPSSGAGKADDPVPTNQNRACATGPLPPSGSGVSFLLFAAAVLLTARSRRDRTK